MPTEQDTMIGRRRGGMMIGIGGDFLPCLIYRLLQRCGFGSMWKLSDQEGYATLFHRGCHLTCMEWDGMSQLFSCLFLLLLMVCRYYRDGEGTM